jgi:hypothetical protein
MTDNRLKFESADASKILENFENCFLENNPKLLFEYYLLLKSKEYGLKINTIKSNFFIPKVNYEEKEYRESNLSKFKKFKYDEETIIQKLLDRKPDNESFSLLSSMIQEEQNNINLKPDNFNSQLIYNNQSTISLFSENNKLQYKKSEINSEAEQPKYINQKRNLKNNSSVTAKKNSSLNSKYNLLNGEIILDMPLFNPNITNN